MNTAAIARHLNVVESAITRCEEWAKVLFVVVKGLGARFVSKKVVNELTELQGSQVEWAASIRSNVVKAIKAQAKKELISPEQKEALMVTVNSKTDSSWWIDNRFEFRNQNLSVGTIAERTHGYGALPNGKKANQFF